MVEFGTSFSSHAIHLAAVIRPHNDSGDWSVPAELSATKSAGAKQMFNTNGLNYLITVLKERYASNLVKIHRSVEFV